MCNMTTHDMADPSDARGESSSARDKQAVDILHELVATPSVSGDEARAVEVFVRRAAQLGFETDVDEAGNGHAIRRCRSTDQSGADNEIVLLGHIDTVPGAVPVCLNDNILYGRGSVDAKGPLAAMLMAAGCAELPPDTQVRVVAAVGEETPRSPGARFLVDRLQPAACIIGEPSGWDGVTLGYKGRLQVQAVVQQPNAHTAGPDASALDLMFQWWARIGTHIEQCNVDRNTTFECIHATLQSCNSFNNGLQQIVELTGGFRLPASISPNELESQIRTQTPGSVELSFDGHEPAHRTDRNDPVVRALSNAIRAQDARPRPKLKTGTADLNVVGPVWNCPIAAYGPGDSALDHTPNEHLYIDEYVRSIRVLTRAITGLARECAAGADSSAS